jgi:coenzyme PQQ synthesis protein D (PqqD)
VSAEAPRFRRSASTLWRDVGGEILLAPPGREDFDQLTGTAATVWLLLEEPQSLEELVGTLADLYGTEAESITVDVERLVSDLVQSGSVREGDADG